MAREHAHDIANAGDVVFAEAEEDGQVVALGSERLRGRTRREASRPAPPGPGCLVSATRA